MNQKITSVAIVCAMLLVGFSINMENNVDAAFVNNMPVPWGPGFTPLDSAWDSSGNNMVVIGNDTSGIQSSAWHYNGGNWTQIVEGTDPNIPPVNMVKNQNTSFIYGSIQAAVDAAAPGNVLEVWAGTYYENIAVGIPITIRGNGSASTIIDGSGVGDVVTIYSSYVNLDGFTVNNSGAGNAGILLTNASNCRIENVTVEDNGAGIYLEGSSDNVIINNDFENNGQGMNVTSTPEFKRLAGVTTYGGYTNGGVMFDMNPVNGSGYNVMHDFQYEYSDGRYTQYGAPAEDILDLYTLYGVTRDGGLYDKGTIYQTDKDGLSYSILHDFEGIRVDDTPTTYGGDNPTGTLLQIGTTLYGVTMYGGNDDYGTIYRIDTDGNNYEIMHHFNGTQWDGREPYAGLTYDGVSLYGTTYRGGSNGLGAVYKINPDGSGFTLIHNFTNGVTGYYPRSGLLLDGTTLYGTSYYGGAGGYGTLYSMETNGSSVTSLHDFMGGAGDGSYPYETVVTDGVTLYGMTTNGGTNSMGVVYSIDKLGGPINILHEFMGSANDDGSYPYGKLVLDGSTLYGVTRTGDGIVESADRGIIFSVDVTGAFYTIVHELTYSDGYYSYSTLMFDGIDLYGTTYYGGASNDGTIFKYDIAGGILGVLRSFSPVQSSEGHNPYGNIMQVGTSLFGTTYNGGAFNLGTIYRTNLDGSGHTVLHNFSSAVDNGYYPYSGVIMVGTTLYGTTYYGGSGGAGTVYKVEMDGTGFMVIHNFTGGADGSYPHSALTWDGNFLYGMTYTGGASNMGTVYRIDNVDGSGYAVLHEFNGFAGLDGDNPYGELMDDGAVLYGMTRDGGSADLGVLFKIEKAFPYGVTILHNFTGGVSDGQDPYGGLVSDGTYVYGMTYLGGASNHGTIFRMKKDSSGFGILHDFDYNADVGFPHGSLVLDGAMLYGMARYGGPGVLIDGGVFKISTASEFTALHYFNDYPTDGANPYYSTPSMVTHPPVPSENNLIYHNNFIGNTQQAWDDVGTNSWANGYPDGGNYWSDYGGVDLMSGPLQSFPPSDGIGDAGHSIPGGMTSDSYPWMRQDGWRLPYSTFTSVAWDDVNKRFWLTCEVSADASSTLYYVENGTSTMIPINAPLISFTAVAADNLGNILIAGNDLDQMFYYNYSENNGYPVTEIGTDKMWGWNITDITFNSNDNRFYIVGNIMNLDAGVAFHTDTVPLDSGTAKCYKDSSAFITGIGGLKAIEWNPVRNYGLAVGDGVYRLDPYDGNPGYELNWTEIESPSTGVQYSDVSWDTNGWNEAGISGDNSTYGAYWRYYHTNPQLQDSFTNGTAGTEYTTCAMKPPASPKWLAVIGPTGALQVNIQELDQSTDVSATASLINPNIYWAGFNDTAMNPKNNQMITPGSSFYITFDGNYSGGWNNVRADITFWYDGGLTGTSSQYPAEIDGNRNRAFNLTYEPLLITPYAINYPVAPELETTIGTVSDTIISNHPFDASQSIHRVVLEVQLGVQMFAADGNGFTPPGPDYASDPNIALDNPNSWDFNITLVDKGDATKANYTYGEFGVNQAISISLAGNPSGEAPPGANGVYLGSSTITYSTNTQYWVNVSIPHLYLNGDVGNPKFIPANNMQVQNTNSLANQVSASDIPVSTYFPGEDMELSVWGASSPAVPLDSPGNGTTAHGPWGSNYNYFDNPGGVTSVEWYVDVPGSLAAGIYSATITYSIETG